MPFVYSNHGHAMRSIVDADYVPQEGEILSPDFMLEEQLIQAFPGYITLCQSFNIMQQISELEAQQTPRRLREASLDENGRQWLENLNRQIESLRTQLAQTLIHAETHS